MRHFLLSALLVTLPLIGANQTATVTPIQSEDLLPYTIAIEQSSFTLPSGLHSGASGVYKGKWVFIAGRTNGLHGFGGGPSFPTTNQNKIVYVVDWDKKTTAYRSLSDSSSGLTTEQIDQLSVTSPQYFQNGKTLYICGGYGVDSATGLFGTKTTLTAVDLPKLIKWVETGSGSALSSIRQTSNSWMQVTGGVMGLIDNRATGLLIFGQNFTGSYTDSSNGSYTRQVRRFQIIDTGKKLYVQERSSESVNADYRRRDLNVVPIIKDKKPAFLALSGVFTTTTGIWTLPVLIDVDGSTVMGDPNDPSSFKQGMNNYVSATVTLFSKSTGDNYVVQLGGISFGYYDSGVFTTDDEFPFINQTTSVKLSKSGNFSQYLHAAEYPVILSTGSNPGNRLIFGAGAAFIPAEGVSTFENGVVNFDKLQGPTVVGYVVGGIMSTLPNTNVITDSTASHYVFKVIVAPKSS